MTRSRPSRLALRNGVVLQPNLQSHITLQAKLIMDTAFKWPLGIITHLRYILTQICMVTKLLNMDGLEY